MPRKRPIWYRKGFSTGGRYDWELEAEMRGYSSVKDMLEDLYIKKNMAYYQVADYLGGISGAGVFNKLKRLGILKGYKKHFNNKFEKLFPKVKECLEQGNYLKDCLALIGYKSSGNCNKGFVGWMRKHKGLVNKGCRKYPKWVFEE